MANEGTSRCGAIAQGFLRYSIERPPRRRSELPKKLWTCDGGDVEGESMMVRITAIAVMLSFWGSGWAHHSRAEFSDDVLELEGELIAAAWINPHPTFRLRTSDSAGDETIWEIQGYGSPYTLQRAGTTAEFFHVGDRVRIAGRRSARRAGLFLGTHVLLPDGLEVILQRDATPRWSDRYVGGRENYLATDANVVVDAARENRGLFRVWSPPAGGWNIPRRSYTETAAAAQAAYDPFTDYTARCENPGMAKFMETPAAFEFTDAGDTILVRVAHYDTVRVIHLGDAEEPETQPPSYMGYAVGHWEGDELVVETTRINFPYMDIRGTPQSEDVEILERFIVSEDQTRLDYRLTVTDPANLREPAVEERWWLALGEEVPPPFYAENCERVD